MAGKAAGGISCSRLVTVAGAICTTLFLVSILVYVESRLLRNWSTRQVFIHGESGRASAAAADTREETDRDDNCLARSEQHRYRNRHLRFPPSKALKERWTRYLGLHSFCSQHVANWTDAFLSGKQVAERGSCRYLIFMEGSAGLGNKILALVSAFTYAMATDRVLLLETGGGKKLGRLLCEPFSWLLPVDFPYELVRQSLPLGAAYEAGLTSVPVVNLHLEHIQSSGDQTFFCDSTHHDLNRDVRWLAWTSTQYYTSRLLMLPSLWHGLMPLFPASNLFTQLSRLIVVPRNPIWHQLVRLYRGYLSCSGLRVGVQIRLHGRWDLAAFDRNVHERVLECLQGSGLLPRTADPNSTTQTGVVVGGSSVAVLVASLQQRYYEEMKREYGERASQDGRIVGVHSCGEGGQQDETLRQARTALLEMWLLSLSDAIATSAYSTFGYVAQGLAGLTPLIMNVRGDAVGPGDELPACYRGLSSEPCTHFPMLSPDCPNATLGNPVTPEHQLWMDAHLQACQDQEGGLQLVWDGTGYTAMHEKWW